MRKDHKGGNLQDLYPPTQSLSDLLLIQITKVGDKVNTNWFCSPNSTMLTEGNSEIRRRSF